MNYHRLCFSVFAVCLITILPSFECTSGIDPAPATVKTSEGTVVVFGCAYSSNPNIVPVWEIDGQRYISVFPDGHSRNATGLVVLANKLFNGYRYKCHFVVPTNSQYQQISSNVAYLYVNSYEIFNVNISKSVQNMEYSFACTVSVDCFATICTSNQVTFQWFHNGATPSSSIFDTSSSGTIPAGSGTVSTSTITTKGNAVVAHAGLFDCRAKLTSDTSFSQSLNIESLYVNMPDSQVVVANSTVDIGTSATLSCEATPPPSVVSSNIQYTYQWQVTGGNSISGATSETYTINSVTLANAGSYTCKVTSKFTGPNKSYVNNPSPQSVVAVLTVRITQSLLVEVPHVEADAGSNANLTCNATLLELQPSLFTFTYTWLDKSNNIISGATTSTLTVSGVSLSNGGIYTCSVTARYNGANAQHVNDQKLTSSGSGVLFVKASINVVMNDITVSFGQSGSLVCNITLQELANSVQVALLNGSIILQNDTITATNNIPTTSFTKTFVVDNVNVSRVGEYVCHVQSVQYNNTLIKFLDNLMLISDTARLYAKVAAPSLTMEDVVGIVESNTILQCRIESVQPMSSVSVQWTKGGAALTTNQATKMLDKIFVSNYTIVNTMAANAGDYKCATVSITYQNQYIVSDNSMVTNHVEVQIDPPNIVVRGNPDFITLGQSVILQCTVTPKVLATNLKLNWTFGSELLEEKTFNTTISSYLLTHSITSTTTSNAGLYKCGVASITYVNSNVSPLPVKSLSLYITVAGPTVTVNSLTKQIGSDVNMTCNIITTQPASSMTVKWRKGSNILVTKTIGSSSSTNFNHILNLKTVSETDGGDYECEVSNIVYTNPYLTSIGGSKTASLTIKIPVPTVAVDVYGSTKVATSEIVISCVVVINKPTSSFVISWQRDNIALTGGFPIGRKSSTKFITFYRINSATSSDSGVYKCQVDSVIYDNTYLTSDPSSDESTIVVINNPESTVPPVIYLVQLSNVGLKFWWKNTANAHGYKLNEYHGCENTPRSHSIGQTCLSVDLLNIERTPPNNVSIYSVQTCNSAQVCSSDGFALQPKNLIAFNFSDQSTLPSSQPTKLNPWNEIYPLHVTKCGGLVVLGIYSSTGDYKEVTNYNLPSFLTQTSLGTTPITLSGSKLNDINVFFDNQNVEWIRIIEKCPIKSCLNDIVFNIGYQGYYHVSGSQVAPEPIPSPCTIDRLETTIPILVSTTKAVIMTSAPPVIRTTVMPPPSSTIPSIAINPPTSGPASGLSTPMIALIVAVSIFVLAMFIVCLLISVLCLRRR